MATTQRIKSVAVTLGCVMAVTAGCTTSADPAPIAPVTVTVTSTPSTHVQPPPASPSPTGSYGTLAASFRKVASSTGLTVGIAVAPVGGDVVPALTLGDTTPRVAWSTIKVPLAVAAERQNGPIPAASAAIINSDNGSAEALWSSLGGGQAAADAVTAVLRDGGDTTTVVPATPRRPGYTIFGQTIWALPDAAAFTANLPCLDGARSVVALMGEVAANQRWGVEVMSAPTATAVKGGWGPGMSEGYLVRQIGLFTYRDGQRTAVAMSAVGGSMTAGIAALNAMAGWLDANMTRLPRGRCDT
ncbi:hypothetical protein FOV72_09565 [Gordonia rubripertincta]|uniref:Serine hydrolase n=1 Tax=Gordonia rubripertincta TaxID=36822 RepID=A0AAW4G1L7_GORRU|nr:hypothetical protein [Gordonia rubripertincta]MBM7277341.1 hypothetical protein [Gordonia rubripertincta]QMU20506.1 hypothetical protein H3V45_21175 [Gordonia rubripertincta]TSD96979.1 hypothetical protein FOV72_09565 [Gordonia rubripertincta]